VSQGPVGIRIQNNICHLSFDISHLFIGLRKQCGFAASAERLAFPKLARIFSKLRFDLQA